MGLFGFLKKKEKEVKKEGYRCTQYALFDDLEFDAQSFIDAFAEDWGVKLDAEVTDSEKCIHISFTIDEIEFVCSFMRGKYPDESPIEAARTNSIWHEAEEYVSSHQAFMIVGILNNTCEDKIKTCSIFTQVCASIMKMPNAICIYNADSKMVIKKDSYRRYMEIMRAAINHNDHYLPYQNWIKVNYVREDDGQIGAFTTGLEIFDKLEIELVHVEYEVSTMQKIIDMLLLGLIMYDNALESGEMIKLDEDIEIVTKKGQGYYLPDKETMRIFH